MNKNKKIQGEKMSKKNNKKNKHLGKVAGGVTISGDFAAGGNFSVKDSSSNIAKDNSSIFQDEKKIITNMNTEISIL